jgi:hypothetical protein
LRVPEQSFVQVRTEHLVDLPGPGDQNPVGNGQAKVIQFLEVFLPESITQHYAT